MRKRLLSWLLVLTMVVGILPAAVFAEENTGTEYDSLIASIEAAYASQTIYQSWENVALVDVDYTDASEWTNKAATAAKGAYDAVVAIGADSATTSDVMKGIFTLAALDYDPTDIMLADGETTINAADKLARLANTADDYYFYTAPFVLLALDAFDALTTEQETAHIELLLSGLTDEYAFSYGVDTPAMTIMGLADAYLDTTNANHADVVIAVDAALVNIKAAIEATPAGMNTNTDAMVILAYTMLGKDPAQVVYSEGTTVVEDMLGAAVSDGTGFGYLNNTAVNTMSTKQGLLALKALAEFDKSDSVAVNPFDLSATATAEADEATLQASAQDAPAEPEAGGGGADGWNGITVTVNISEAGEFLTDKERNTTAGLEVQLLGYDNTTYDINGALYAVHENYHADGVSAYGTSLGDYGLYLSMLWGDTSGNFGYQVNGGTETVSGLTHGLDDGDVVDVYIYGGNYNDGTLESYSRFATIPTATAGEAVTVTLEQAGYDASYNSIFSPCTDATIYIDGEETAYITDTNGQANITFATAGDHWLTAKKDANNDNITDIVAPYAAVTVAAADGGSGSGSGSGGTTSSTIEVTFTVEADGDTWFEEDLELVEGDTVKAAFYAAFDKHKNYDYEIDGGSYVESITHPTYGTYGEFTHGTNSGWKYSVNDYVPEIGFNSYDLEDGDEVLFYYIMDYTTESSGSSSTEITTTEETEELTATEFSDVTETDWFAAAVSYAVENGLFDGISDTTFAPNDTMTRAMIWTVLARAAGEDTTTGDSWYEAGMDWATEAGISDGNDPDGSVTREQLAAMLYRYEQSKGGGFTGSWMFQMEYDDLSEVSDWATEAIYWMVMNGVITGTSETTLDPNEIATRAQVAAMVMRYLEL